MVNVVACQVYMHSGRCSSQAGRSAFNTMVNAVACQVYMHSGRCSSQAGRSAFNTMVNAVACQDYMCILVGAAHRLAGLHSTRWSMQLLVKITCVFWWVQLTGWPVCTQHDGQCSCLSGLHALWRVQLTGWPVCTQHDRQCSCLSSLHVYSCGFSSQAGRSALNTIVNAVACQDYMCILVGAAHRLAGLHLTQWLNAAACQDYMCILVGAADRLAGLHSTQWSMQLHVKSTCVFLWVQLTGWPVCTQCNGQCGCILYTEAMLCRKQLTGWLVCTQGNEQCGCILDTKAMLCRKQLTGWPVCTQCNGQCGCILDTKAMLCRKQLTGWPVCTQPGERCSSLARNKLSWAGLAHRRNILASLPENLMQSHFKNASNRPYHKCKESKVGGRHIRHAHDLFHKHFITSI